MSLLKEGHVYSYSQLTSFCECPFSYYLCRIEGCEQAQNAFAEQGTLIHSIILRWANKEITKEEMVTEYEMRYPDEVTCSFPKMLASKGYAEKTYQAGLDYFKNFDEFNGLNIIQAEKKFEIPITLSNGETRRFVGVIDLILEDPVSGQYIICDHKSKSLSSFKKDKEEMYKQQLVYSSGFFQEYEKYPDVLMFNLFKENGYKDTKDFNKEEYDKVMKWVADTIERIESFDTFDFMQSKEQDFFCLELCSARKECPNGVNKPKSKKK